MRYVDAMTGDAGGLAAWLLPELEKASAAGLRTGFLSLAGAEMITPPLQQMLERGGDLCIVIGGSPEQTEPAAVAVLADLAGKFPDRAAVYLARPGGGLQNAKTYYVRNENGCRAAYVGSANLTGAGLGGNFEAGVILEDSADGADAVEAVMTGIQAWADHRDARRVTPEMLGELDERSWRRFLSAAGRTGADVVLPLSELLPDALVRVEAIGSAGPATAGVATGFADLDSLTNGLHPGSLTVIGGRPAMGKSVLLLDFCRAAAVKSGIPAALFSLEAPSSDIIIRLLSAESRVALHSMRTGQMNEDDWTMLARRMTEIAHAPLFVTCPGSAKVDDLREHAARLVQDHGVELIAIDYLQLVSPPARSESREREVADITRQLKALAMELQVPVVVAAQLNRGPEQRTDKRPQLGDLRESDAIAQAADVVILLHREDYYYSDSPRAGEADFIIAKHRQCPTTTITVAFQGHYSRFVDMAKPGTADRS